MSTFMRLSTFSFLFVALTSSITACSSSDDDGSGQQPPRPDAGKDSGGEKPDGSIGEKPDSGGGGNPREKLVKACIDLGDAFAKAYARCGADYQQAYNAFLAKFGGSTCSYVVSIRNESELRGQCIPWFGTASCSALMSSPPAIDPSCQEQLEVPARLMQGDLEPQAATSETSAVPLLEGLVGKR